MRYCIKKLIVIKKIDAVKNFNAVKKFANQRRQQWTQTFLYVKQTN